MPVRPRDSQRSKILSASDAFRLARPTDCKLSFELAGTRRDWSSAQNELCTILGKPWYTAYCNEHNLILIVPYIRVYKSKNGSDHVQKGTWINLSPTRFDKIELLRYVAQTLIPDDAAWHGPEFVKAYLHSIEQEMSSEASKAMLQLLRLRKVRRRIMDPEVRERRKVIYEEKRRLKAISQLQDTLKTLENNRGISE